MGRIVILIHNWVTVIHKVVVLQRLLIRNQNAEQLFEEHQNSQRHQSATKLFFPDSIARESHAKSRAKFFDVYIGRK